MRAIEDYITETQLNPNFTNAYVNLGVAYRAVDELDLAIESYTVMIVLDPNSPLQLMMPIITEAWFILIKVTLTLLSKILKWR